MSLLNSTLEQRLPSLYPSTSSTNNRQIASRSTSTPNTLLNQLRLEESSRMNSTNFSALHPKCFLPRLPLRHLFLLLHRLLSRPRFIRRTNEVFVLLKLTSRMPLQRCRRLSQVQSSHQRQVHLYQLSDKTISRSRRRNSRLRPLKKSIPPLYR